MIGDKIKEIAKRRGIKLEDVAKHVGYSRAGFSRALKEADFKISVLEKLASFLDVEIGYFFDIKQPLMDELKMFFCNSFGFISENRVDEMLADNNRFNAFYENEYTHVNGTASIVLYIRNAYFGIVYGDLFDDLFPSSNYSFEYFDFPMAKDLVFTCKKTGSTFEFNRPYNIEHILKEIFSISEKEVAKMYLIEVRKREKKFEKFIKKDSALIQWAVNQNIISEKMIHLKFIDIIREYSPKDIK